MKADLRVLSDATEMSLRAAAATAGAIEGAGWCSAVEARYGHLVGEFRSGSAMDSVRS